MSLAKHKGARSVLRVSSQEARAQRPCQHIGSVVSAVFSAFTVVLATRGGGGAGCYPLCPLPSSIFSHRLLLPYIALVGSVHTLAQLPQDQLEIPASVDAAEPVMLRICVLVCPRKLGYMATLWAPRAQSTGHEGTTYGTHKCLSVHSPSEM